MKLIVDNRSSLPMEDALDLARRTVAKGRTQKDGAYGWILYEIVTARGSRQVMALGFKNKASDRIMIYNHPSEDKL